ncbi:FecR domain-containing protein [uncultured Draconibacterium sp.]|uniref:FecR family protein n=1 Tax=uncultured Draconibacterium sp. TaxID=1573823 RepID=UPI00321786B1
MNSEDKIHLLIIRLFTGEADPNEKKYIRDWLNQSADNKLFFNELKDIWLSSGVKNNADNYQLDKAIASFSQKIKASEKNKVRKLNVPNLLKYAAIAVLLVALPFMYFLGNKNAAVQDSYTTITCALGDKSNLVLPDSTLVCLNSGSTLRFNNNFKKGVRQVFLDGEAYFSVTKDAENPFRIKTNEIDVEVLGTEFNMKAYSDEKTVSTTLVEGSVKISSQHQETVIKPGQKLVYSVDSKKMALYELADLSPETEWKDGRLVFRNESLGDLEFKLERWFDVDIVLADEAVKKRKYTGTLERESILEVMSYFKLARSVDYELEGNKITFFTTNKK